MAHAKEKRTGFAERLRQLRNAKNLSQTELAELIDVHYTHISRYERDDSRPSAESAKALADALGVTVDFLLNGETKGAVTADFQDKDFLNMFKAAENLSEEDKILVKKFLGAFIATKQVHKLTA